MSFKQLRGRGFSKIVIVLLVVLAVVGAVLKGKDKNNLSLISSLLGRVGPFVQCILGCLGIETCAREVFSVALGQF